MPPITIAADRMPTHGRTEWLLANGLGGFAMGCAAGMPERRYHALLVGALNPPVGRVVGLSGVADAITAEFSTPRGPVTERRALSGFRFRGWSGEFAPPPTAFVREGDSARWTFRPWGSFREIAVERTLRLVDGRNAAVITYEARGPGRVRLELSPLTALRDFHELTHGGGSASLRVSAHGTVLAVEGPAGAVRFAAPGATLVLSPDWWWNFEYARDRERGQDCVEDLLCPGRFTADLDASKGPARLHLLAWMDDAPAPDSSHPAPARVEHAAACLKIPDREQAGALARAADQFVVRRDLAGSSGTTPMTTIIAGYPWFSDWGRDTMIALPGLLLATGRHDEARTTLLAFARMQRRGLVPNCFDNAGAAQYNTVDGSLWFVQACCEFARTAPDRAAFDDALLPACLAVIDAYRDGTDFEIRMDPADGLIAAGTPSTQLTWMDAARDGVIFTPRHGKAVEINALWHSALRRLARAAGVRHAAKSRELAALADLAGASFRLFWNPQGSCLFDRLEPAAGGWSSVAEVRPNQIFAVSLPHSALDAAQQRAVVACVRNRLLTPHGLRTLDPAHPNYRPRYEGNLFERDGAYHNGTVWPYLLGAYAEAVLRTERFSAAAREHVRTVLTPLLSTLAGNTEPDGPLGSICEVYDGEDPRRPQGCPMQAWSVAEVLRALALSHSDPAD